MSMTGMDYSMGGGRVKYREIATAAANQTYGQQLAQLKTTYDTLTDEEKMRCVIHLNGLIFRASYISNNSGLHSCAVINATEGYIYCLDIVAKKRYSLVNIVSGAAIQDQSSTTSSYVMSLMMLDIVSE